MDKITKSLLDDYVESEEISHLKTSEAFERFAAYSILSPKVHDSLIVEDVSVGRNSTPGIDSLAIIIGGTLVPSTDDLDALLETAGFIEPDFYFIQTKTSSSFEGAQIANFGEEVRAFFVQDEVSPQLKAAKEVTERLLTLGSRLRRNPNCHLFYVTAGRWQNDDLPTRRVASSIERLQELSLFQEVSLDPLGSSDIQKRFRSVKNSVSVEFSFRDKVTLPSIDGVDQSYLGYLPAEEFLKIITDESGDLRRGIFEDNVRDFQGAKNEVNSGIQASIEQSGDRFVVLNNGVTIVGRALGTRANQFTLEDFQIVNGCQTSNILYDLADQLNNVSVPVRIVITRNDHIANTITAATNSQTRVSKEDLYALLSFQKKLEEYFATFDSHRKLYYERRSQQYAGITSIPRNRITTRAQMVKAFASVFLDEPHRATRYYSTLYSQVGERIFDDDHKLENYYVSALALYRLETSFRSQALWASLKPARYHILHAIRHMAIGENLEPLNSKKQETTAEKFSTVLWDDVQCIDLYRKASLLVHEAVGGNDLTRDFTKQQSLTKKIAELAANYRSQNTDNWMVS